MRLCQDKCRESALLLQASSPAGTTNSSIGFCSQLKTLYLQLIAVLYKDLQANSGLSSLGFTFQVPTFLSVYSQHHRWCHLHFWIFNINRFLKETHYWPSWVLWEQTLQILKAVLRGEQAAPGETSTSHVNMGKKCLFLSLFNSKWC